MWTIKLLSTTVGGNTFSPLNNRHKNVFISNVYSDPKQSLHSNELQPINLRISKPCKKAPHINIKPFITLL